MLRHKQRAIARSQGYNQAREISIPLPLKGAFAEARTAEVPGIYAGDLKNWRSTGFSLQLREQFSLDESSRVALQRIPFEFRGRSLYFLVDAESLALEASAWRHPYNGSLQCAYISSHAVLVDGATEPVIFDGASFSTSSFSSTTDATPAGFDGVIAHHDRLYFWRRNDTLDFYYGDVGAISGHLERFPLSRLGNVTGSIMALHPLTIDAGNGINDVLAIFTTTGKLIIYEGLDPGDPQSWRVMTRIDAAPPINQSAFVKVGADLWMLTSAGVVSVTQTIRDSSLALVNTISRPIQEKLIAQIRNGGDWSMHLSADSVNVIINCVKDRQANQYVFRTDSKTWLETDYPARNWHNLGQKTQFTALNGMLATLNPIAGSEAIHAAWTSSWFRLPKTSGITYLRPTIIAQGPLSIKVTLLSDHDATGRDIMEAVQVVEIAPDSPADPGGKVSLNDLIAVDAVGEVFQLKIEVTAKWAELVNLKAGIQ